MDSSQPAAQPAQSEKVLTPRRSRGRRILRLLAIYLTVYFLGAYVMIPAAWRRVAARHPALEQNEVPRITHTKDHIPGDPLNLAFVAHEKDLTKAMLAGGWGAADPITLKTSLRIAGSTVRRRPYDTAPVSNLYVWGRKQDLAFQQPVGGDPRKRHHVRFWRSDRLDEEGRPLWIGAATFDTRVGLSHRTGQITHHIDANVDAERDKLLKDLRRAGVLAELRWIDGFHQHREGRNGGGDRYHTDGRLPLGILSVAEVARAADTDR
jgi:hypothetical protein